MMLKPYTTEKSLKLAKEGVFTFIATTNVNKLEVAKFLKRLHAVTVERVTVINRKPKAARAFKKIMVKVAKNQKIPGFETVQEPKDAKKT